MTSWNFNIWNSKLWFSWKRIELLRWNKKTFALVSQVLLFRLNKQTDKNVAGTTFKKYELCFLFQLSTHKRFRSCLILCFLRPLWFSNIFPICGLTLMCTIFYMLSTGVASSWKMKCPIGYCPPPSNFLNWLQH